MGHNMAGIHWSHSTDREQWLLGLLQVISKALSTAHLLAIRAGN